MILFLAAPSFTMSDLTVCPRLMLLLVTYCYYFASTEFNNFRGHYSTSICPYKIDTAKSAATTAPAKFARQIYAVEQEGVPPAFL